MGGGSQGPGFSPVFPAVLLQYSTIETGEAALTVNVASWSVAEVMSHCLEAILLESATSAPFTFKPSCTDPQAKQVVDAEHE